MTADASGEHGLVRGWRECDQREQVKEGRTALWRRRESMILNDRHQGALRCMGPREGAGCFPWHGGNRRNGPVRTGRGKDFQMGS